MDPKTKDWLRAHGYSVATNDMCWLDCASPGYVKSYRRREICLCVEHALVLESGKFGGSYDGAPLPVASVATEWPWRPATPVALPV